MKKEKDFLTCMYCEDKHECNCAFCTLYCAEKNGMVK